MFNSKTTLSQDEAIPNNAVCHIITNQFNPIDTIKLKNEVHSVYNGDLENEYTIVITVEE
ncbi:hypothetical protein N9F08_00185 [bacterium]|nr:hypothetical protein [bacterium]